MKVFSTIAIAAMSLVFMSIGTAYAAPKCGCVKTWKSCTKKARKATKTPKPGAAAKNIKDRKKMFKACDKAFKKCSKKCDKECVSECRTKKKIEKKNCREDFRDTLCPAKGKDHRSCVKTAKKERNACVKEAKSDNCKKSCK